jgi:predicted LPLAT superfamily acyltransferase
MHSLEKLNRTVHLLMRPEENPALRKAVQVDTEKSRIKIISPDQEMGGVVSVMQALDQGDIVSIMGDRTYGADGVDIQFLGDQARLPYSAFHFAASARCPVVVLLSSKTGTHSYSVDMAAILYPKLVRGSDRREQLRGWVQQYADILGNYLLAHPLQYFIFHDIWADDN